MGQGGHGWKKILMNDKKSMWMDEFKYKCISSVFIYWQHTCVPFVDGY